MARKTRNIAERFWEKVDKSGPIHPYDPAQGPCWVWTAGKTPAGYGNFSEGKVRVMAHRWAWANANGQIPEGIEVCHSCDRPACVRHLFLGTHGDNIRDCFRKGRANRCSGERHWSKTHQQEAARQFGEVNFAAAHPELMARGERHPNAKITETTVLGIMDLKRRGLSHREIGAALGVSRENVVAICTGRTWCEVTGLPRRPCKKRPARGAATT